MGTDAERASTFEGSGASRRTCARVARPLRLRVAPEIAFRLDESVARAARIESLLAQVKTQDATAARDGRPRRT